MDRAIHFDFHTMPGIDGFLKDFSAEKIAKTLRKANVTYVNVAARCNIGFSYYDTKIGFRYPEMKGDMLGELISALHSEGLGVTAYLNGGLNHELLLHRPELSKQGRGGETISGDPVRDNFFRSPCFNSEYRQHLLGEIAEILEYHPDGIFCDCMLVRPCRCPKCTEKMKELGFNPEDDEDAYKYAYGLIIEVSHEIKSIVPENVRLYINSFPYEAISDCESHVELECLPTDGVWGYDFFGVLAPYYRDFSKDRVYMTGRFVDSWGDFGGVKSRASLENDMYDALLYGYGISVGDHMHPHGTIDKELYETIGEMYEFKKSLEQYTAGARVVADVCLIRNKPNYKNTEPSAGDRGACRMLSELKVLYDIKDESMDFSGYRMLIVPNGIEMTDTLVKKLSEFSGAVISVGESIKEGGIWDYVTLCGKDTHDDAFYKTKSGAVRACYAPSVLIKSENGISPYIEPYFNRVYDGRHGYFYIPPKRETEYCAVAVSGRRAHICFDIFRAYYEQSADFHRETVAELLGELPERLSLEAEELPKTARAALHKRDEKTLLMIKTTYPEHKGTKGIIDEHNVMSGGRHVRVLGSFSKASAVRAGRELSISAAGEYSEIELPEICGFEMIILE